MSLPRKLMVTDSRGRLTIPKNLREKLGWDLPVAVWVELYPPNEPKCLVIKRQE